jgi:hypothetical protein
MRALVAALLGSLVLPAAASAAPAASPAPTLAAQLPGVPCSVSATLHLDAGTRTMTYGGSIHCTGAAGQKTVDVVPQVSNVIAGKRLWFNITLAGRYQGPTAINPLSLTDSRPYVPSHAYRLLVYGQVKRANGRVVSVTVCSGCAGSAPALRITPSHTFHAKPASTTKLAGTSCTLTQNGLVFTLVNGSYVLDYGAGTDCGGSSAKSAVTVCAQVSNRSNGRTVWFTITGSCLSAGPTLTRLVQASTARTAYLGHGYRIMARTTVVQSGVTRSVTAFSGAAAP